MSISDKAWFVDYAHSEWNHCYIVIHCEKRSDVKNILKRHLGNFGIRDFTINRVAEWDSDRSVPDDWKNLTEEDVL